ncbi:hypothetical protein C4Q21_14065 [Faecalibacterium prausnitzii]|nr:hypothetical protein C4Q21_14065 [Faecalibacterium prausnitzii]
MRAAFALRIFSGRMIFNFGIPERLRTLRYPFFHGRGQATEEVFSRAKGLLHGLCSSPLFMLLSGGQSAAQISFFRVSPMM